MNEKTTRPQFTEQQRKQNEKNNMKNTFTFTKNRIHTKEYFIS